METIEPVKCVRCGVGTNLENTDQEEEIQKSLPQIRLWKIIASQLKNNDLKSPSAVTNKWSDLINFNCKNNVLYCGIECIHDPRKISGKSV